MLVLKTSAARTILALSVISLTTVSPCTGLVAGPLSRALPPAVRQSPQNLTTQHRAPVASASETESRAEPLEFPAVFLRGDADGNGSVDMTDSLYTLSSLFVGSKELRCQDAADADDSGEVELTDAVLVLGYLFAGGDTIAAPFPGCGLDVTADRLECEGVEACASEPETFLAVIPVDNGYVVEFPPEILEAIPEGVTVRLRRVEGGTTKVLEGVASRFSETSLLVESSEPTPGAEPVATAVARVRLGGSVLAAGGLVLAPTTPSFECGPLGCICDEDTTDPKDNDCTDMFGSGACGDGICWDDESGLVVCICVR